MKNPTISRGYRLKASTHRLIKKIQSELNVSQNKIILKGVKLYYEQIKNSSKKTNNGSNIY